MTTDALNLPNRVIDFQKGARGRQSAGEGIARVESRMDGKVSRQEVARSGQPPETDAAEDCNATNCSETNVRSFDDMVEDLGDVEDAASPGIPLQAASAEKPSQQMPLAIVQFSGLLQRIDAQNGTVSDDGARAESREQPQLHRERPPLDVMLKSEVAEVPIAAVQATEFDVRPSSDQSTMREKLPSRQLDAELSDGKHVSIERLQKVTGFASPITVLASEQRRFQPAQAVVSRLAAMFLQGNDRSVVLQTPLVANFVRPSSARIDFDIDMADKRADETVQMPLSELEPRQARALQTSYELEQTTWQAARGAEVTEMTSVKVEINTAPNETAMPLSAPGQQVRIALAEALTRPGAAPATDYVSLFADRPPSTSPMLRTLELALSPQGLGNVQITLNLAGSDLRLDVEATQADTARLIASDRDELQRELRSDGVELSSLSVAVREHATRIDDVRDGGGGRNLETSWSGAEGGIADMNRPRDESGTRRESRQAFGPPLKRSGDAVVDASPAADQNVLYI